MAASGRLDKVGTLSGNDRYLREAAGWNRRIALKNSA
jgi:hypothetical protein